MGSGFERGKKKRKKHGRPNTSSKDKTQSRVRISVRGVCKFFKVNVLAKHKTPCATEMVKCYSLVEIVLSEDIFVSGNPFSERDTDKGRLL